VVEAIFGLKFTVAKDLEKNCCNLGRVGFPLEQIQIHPGLCYLQAQPRKITSRHGGKNHVSRTFSFAFVNFRPSLSPKLS
jgi:hypothetical protein